MQLQRLKTHNMTSVDEDIGFLGFKPPTGCRFKGERKKSHHLDPFGVFLRRLSGIARC